MEHDLGQLALCRDKLIIGAQSTYKTRNILTRLDERRTRNGKKTAFYNYKTFTKQLLLVASLKRKRQSEIISTMTDENIYQNISLSDSVPNVVNSSSRLHVRFQRKQQSKLATLDSVNLELKKKELELVQLQIEKEKETLRQLRGN
jgi:hypothetical protein